MIKSKTNDKLTIGNCISADLYYPILNIIREESKHYEHKPDTKKNIVVIDENGNEYAHISMDKFMQESKSRLDAIKTTRKTVFEIPSRECFMSEIGYTKPKVPSIDKADIHIVIHDLCMNITPELGFCINSQLGSPSTLLNAGSGTNFIFEAVLPEGKTMDCDEFNKRTYPISGRIGARLKSLVDDYNATIKFVGIQSRCLAQNLEAIDGHMPRLLAELLLINAASGCTSIQKCTELLTEQNPFGFDTQTHGNIYEYKVKRFLQDCAQGMTPETPWLGIYDATGGQIIVKESGDIVCYHIYELNRFRNYLYNSTKFERASTSEDESNPGHPRTDAKKPFNYGWLYKENGHYYIKINLQVRSK